MAAKGRRRWPRGRRPRRCWWRACRWGWRACRWRGPGRPRRSPGRQLQSTHGHRLGFPGEHVRLRCLQQRAHREARQNRQVHQGLGNRRAPSRGSSTCPIRWPWTLGATSTWRISGTSGFRSSTTTGTSRRRSPMWARRGRICISPGAHQYLYSSNSNPPDSMDNGEIYKMELDGKVLGQVRHGGQTGEGVRHGELRSIAAIRTRFTSGELTNWRVQKYDPARGEISSVRLTRTAAARVDCRRRLVPPCRQTDYRSRDGWSGRGPPFPEARRSSSRTSADDIEPPISATLEEKQDAILPGKVSCTHRFDWPRWPPPRRCPR